MQRRALLQATVAAYNEGAARGEDPLLHKKPEWIKPIGTPVGAIDLRDNTGGFTQHPGLGTITTTDNIWSSLLCRDPGAEAAFYQTVFSYDVFDLASDDQASGLHVDDAVIEHVPAATIVAVLPFTPVVVQMPGVLEANVTGFPEPPPLALTVNAGSP